MASRRSGKRLCSALRSPTRTQCAGRPSCSSPCLDDHVAAIRLETESRITLTKDQQFQVSQQAPLVSLGAVEGRIQALSSRRGLRFTLYDIIEDRAVGCYLQPGEEGMMRELWGRRAIVEGEVRRDPQSGRPTKIRRVTAVEPVPEDPAPRSWREVARGTRPASGTGRPLRTRSGRSAMPGKAPKRSYWDACVFLAWICKEPDRADVIDALLDSGR